MFGGPSQGKLADALETRKTKLERADIQNYVYSAGGSYPEKPEKELLQNATESALKHAARKPVTKIGMLTFEGERCFLVFERKRIDELLPKSAQSLQNKTTEATPVKFELQNINGFPHIKLLTSKTRP